MFGRIPIPLPSFRAKGCQQGAHYMRAHRLPDVPDGGGKVWRCVSCPYERPFRTALFEKGA